jgi:mevalonate kinase
MTSSLHANGKLLLTAEYFVLDGALALALPVKMGQSLSLPCLPEDRSGGEIIGRNGLRWQSFDEKEQLWFEAEFDLRQFDILYMSDPVVSKRLQNILLEARRMNASFPAIAQCAPEENAEPILSSPLNPATKTAFHPTVRCHLEFPRQWGLGTSSTLVYLIAKWAHVDPYELQFRTFGGSGYDIACAGASEPVLYSLQNGKPRAEPCYFRPVFADLLYFIYSGKKQDSREGITRYRELADGKQSRADEISILTKAILAATTLEDFQKLIREHERIVGEAVKMKRVKDLYFKDFWGEVKSLGAWGGDFVLASSDRPEAETRHFFNEKGFDVFIPYNNMIL